MANPTRNSISTLGIILNQVALAGTSLTDVYTATKTVGAAVTALTFAITNTTDPVVEIHISPDGSADDPKHLTKKVALTHDTDNEVLLGAILKTGAKVRVKGTSVVVVTVWGPEPTGA